MPSIGNSFQKLGFGSNRREVLDRGSVSEMERPVTIYKGRDGAKVGPTEWPLMH